MSAGTPSRGAPRGRRWPSRSAVLVLLLIVTPLAEIALILAVGRAIGGWPTFLLLLVESLFGAWLMKREGRTAWAALLEALRTGRMPARELTDGALILVGGALLLTPGFLTDAAGFLVVAPPTRPYARRLLQRAVERRLLAQGPWPGAGGTAGGRGPDVVEGEVL